MKGYVLLPVAGCLIVGIGLMTTGGPVSAAAAQAAGRGSIKGHIKLMGKLPGNPVIRMGMDPMCAKINAGKRIIQETVVASLDGGLANVFVHLQGSFPQTPVPATPVTIDQHGCVYGPRVAGVRVGQMLQIKNSDPMLHNVHGMSVHDNGFNAGQPQAGIVQQFRMKSEEVMLHLKCDVHSWMTAYVGVVTNPYFAVSQDAGVFEIVNVPPGTYTIQAWHERYGPLMKTVTVKAGAPTTVDFSYTGTEKAVAGLHDLVVPAGMMTARSEAQIALQ